MIAKRAKMMELGTMVLAPDIAKATKDEEGMDKVTLDKGRASKAVYGRLHRPVYGGVFSICTVDWSTKLPIDQSMEGYFCN